MKKYLLEVTEEQLRLIAECVEDCHRFMAGEYSLHNMTSRLDTQLQLQELLKGTKPYVTPLLHHFAVYGWDGGHCENDEQRKFIAKTYLIYREIYHFLTLEKGLQNTYTSKTLTCDEGGEPIKIKRIYERTKKKNDRKGE